jgi:hypothetical protein
MFQDVKHYETLSNHVQWQPSWNLKKYFEGALILLRQNVNLATKIQLFYFNY